MFESINELILTKGLWTLFFLMVTNGIASVPPSEIILFFGGVYSKTLGQNFYLVLLVMVAGNLAGAYILYSIGRIFGYEWIFRSKFLSRFVQEDKIHKLAKKFRRDGAHWVGIFRCLPGTRSIVSIPAGMVRMPHHVFLGYTALGALVWAIFWQSLGYFIGLSFLQYKFYVSLSLVFLLILTLLVFKKVAHKYINAKI